MNILILDKSEIGQRIPRSDRRWEHIKRILKKHPGDELAAGLVTEVVYGPAAGSLGKARIVELDEAGLRLDYRPESSAPPLAPIRLLLGFPRPIQAKRILTALASLGIAEIHLTGTELGEKSYLESDVFAKKEFRQSLIEGGEQAGNPRLPAVSTHWSLRRALETLAAAKGGEGADWPSGDRIVLHPLPGAPFLGSATLAAPMTLVVGSERGWTEGELALLEEKGYRIFGLGRRIVRTETACLAATAIALGKLGLM